ncbi:MAG TPA: methyltransferase domain-containing protein [Candidatus Paceibacterota bacterium]|nr:methyltransferase domain-containing protein [Candidatus Paceibacterota bacterium]
MFLHPKKFLPLAHINPGQHIADFESGSGHFALEAARLLLGEGKIYAIGSQSDMLRKIAKNAKEEGIQNLEILSGHIEKANGVPLKDGMLDLVIISNTLFGVDKKDQTANEAFRLLHKNGRVLLVEWLDSFKGLGPHKDHVVSKEAAKEIFEKAGFELMKEIDARHFHYAFIFQKKE